MWIWAVCVIGAPVPLMFRRVLHWLETGIEVKSFTARAADPLPKGGVFVHALKP